MLLGLSGLEVMEELRGDSATSHIAVLMLTARRERATGSRDSPWAPTIT